MNTVHYLLISAVVAALSTAIASVLSIGGPFGLLVLIFAACLLSLFAGNWLATKDSHSGQTTANNSKGFEQGKVKWFNPNKGFGFIVRDSGEEIFVHYRSIIGEGRRTLRDGQRVQFKIGKGDKGLQAEEVSRIQ